MIEQVKIDTIIYQVVETPEDIIDPKGKGWLGRISFGNALIQIRENMTAECKIQVLWHEVIHAIATQRNVKISEEEIDALAFGMVGVLQRNPVLRNGEWKA